MVQIRGLRDFNDSDLADGLVAQGVLKRAAADRALKAAQGTGAALERTLLELGLASETQVYQHVAEWLDLPFVTGADIDPVLIKSLPLDHAFLERVEAIPVTENDNGSITFATSNPRGADAMRSISFHLGQDVEPAICARSTVRQSLGNAQDATKEVGADAASDVERLRFLSNEGPIISLTNDLLSQAVGDRASDVHIEALDGMGRVRFRVDGVLRVVRTLTSEDLAMVTSRLKVMADLNISEKRRPQDGRARIAVMGRNVDLRLSTLPAQHGESVVVRILDREALALDWEVLGFAPNVRDDIRGILGQASGIFLAAGPTGSGKTTTLYTALSELATDARKVITVEDPVEYAVPGVMQVQVRPEIDMTFARTLRAILRQDPDTILIGEIRDQETAEIAVRAALVGRLVLSTVHTNDSLSAVDRLLDLGIPSYLLSATLRGVMSQRLVRRLCATCSGAGCDSCDQTGYKGRAVVTELMKVPAEAAADLVHVTSAADIPSASLLRQFEPLRDSARALVDQGVTSEEELLRLDLS
ncbi:type II/IV secretion system protein [uncultured Tateyamaria sp.]|uniref:GspE/PulE family protein n=1 Tax=Tateyamaria sp. 1078 TaxID=3417464 RepID=UPI002631912E|nr:type II/IV secretion system protein [uncultured Tateyamaria sp.]